MAAPHEKMLEFAQEWVESEKRHIQHTITRLEKELENRNEDEGRNYLRDTLLHWRGRADLITAVRDELVEGLADYVTFQSRDHAL